MLIVFKKAFLMIRFQCFQSMIILRRKIQISMTFHFFIIQKIEINDLKQWPAALILYLDASDSVVDRVIDGNHSSVLLSPLHSFLSIIVNLVLVNLNYHVVNEEVKVGVEKVE